MTPSTPEQQRAETAGRGVAAKFHAFHDSLTLDEQQLLDTALRKLGEQSDEVPDDAIGHSPVTSLELAAIRVVYLLTGLETFPPFQPRRPSP